MLFIKKHQGLEEKRYIYIISSNNYIIMKAIISILLILTILVAGCATVQNDSGLKITRVDKGFHEASSPQVIGGNLLYHVTDNEYLQYIIFEDNLVAKKDGKGWIRIPSKPLTVFSDGTIFFTAEDENGDMLLVSNNPNTPKGDSLDYKKVVDDYSKQAEILKEDDKDSKGCEPYHTDLGIGIDYGKTTVDYDKKPMAISCNGETVSQGYAYIDKDSIFWIGDKLIFKAQKERNSNYIIYDNHEIGGTSYSYIGNLVNYKGKLIFHAQSKNGDDHVYVVE